MCAFFNEIRLRRVKYGSAMWNSTAVKYLLRKCEKANFISHRTESQAAWDISQFSQENYFTFTEGEYFTKFKSCIFVLRAYIGATVLHPNTKVLDFQGLFVFLGIKTPPFTIAPFLEPFGLEPATLWGYIEFILFLWYNLLDVIMYIGQIISQNDEKYIV